MHKNKVIQVLKSLSADEMRQLDKFVRSPVHNRHDDVIRFFQYARKHLTGSERALKKENVFENLFPGEVFDMQKVHYVSSYLLKVVEEFLAWQEWRSNEGDYHLHLLRSLRQHRLDGFFATNFEKTADVLAKSALRNVGNLHHGYQLELERFNHDRLKTGKQEFRLQEMSDSLDVFFIAEKLRNACILLSNQTVSKTSYNTGLLAQVLAFLKGHRYLENPVIAIYYHASRTLDNFEDDESFRQLKILLEKHRKSFNVNELHDVYIFAINYCIRRLNSSEQGFMREVFDIYRMGLETDAFVQNGLMTPRTYSNIVLFGLRLNELEWVEDFIFHNKDALPEKQREGFFNYNLARLYYEKCNFGQAMPLLLQMEYEDVLLACLGKILLAKMYYEQGEWETLNSLFQSFKAYLGRKKGLSYHKETCNNFIYFTQKLMHPNAAKNPQLKQELTETKVVAEKEWLLAQMH